MQRRQRAPAIDAADNAASLHVVDIQCDSRTHYHKSMTEIYLVLEGQGQQPTPVQPTPLPIETQPTAPPPAPTPTPNRRP